MRRLLQLAALLALCVRLAPAAAVRLPWSQQRPCHDVRVGSVVPSQNGDGDWAFSPAAGGERHGRAG